MEIKKKICPYCGKKIESLYDKQLDYNYKLHVESCERKAKNNSNTKEVLNNE
jgi:hypothetical protein